MQDAYAYDAHANVTAITDQQEGLSSRAMGYDGLDRLSSASGIWGAGSFGYDPLDNLRTSTVGARTVVASIDGANRLGTLSVNGVVQTYGYDLGGNLTVRGGQNYTFDIGNRLNTAWGKASYSYDGHGRRTWVAYADGSWKLQLYSQAGKLLWSQHSSQGNTKHVYLGDRLIVEANTVGGLSYSHTDALGSPVARTNAAAQITGRTRYEPYGATAAGTNPAGIGFTGHVNDADTGLVYMQQRYYEPVAGRFLSVDPVTTDFKSGAQFNRYAYVNNNPYKFKDPDGRILETVWDVASLVLSVREFVANPSVGNAVGVALDTAAVLIPGVPGGVGVARAATSTATSAAKAADKVGDAAKEAQAASKVFSKEKQALVDMAKADKKTGVTRADMKAYEDLNKGLKDPFPANKVRTDEGHSRGAPHSQVPHGHVGPIDHIPVVNP